MPRQYTRIPPAVRFWRKVKKTKRCWLWTGSKAPSGYGLFRPRRDGPSIGVHRFAYELTYGPIEPGLFVCHHCDNPRCVRPDHLFLGTHADNMRDMHRKGRGQRGDTHWMHRHPEKVPRGERHWSSRHPEKQRRGTDIYAAKLTDQQVLEIRSRYRPYVVSKQTLANEHGVSRRAIDLIIRRETWRHL